MWLGTHVIAFVICVDDSMRAYVGKCRPHVWGLMWGCADGGNHAGRDPVAASAASMRLGTCHPMSLKRGGEGVRMQPETVHLDPAVVEYAARLGSASAWL